MLQSVAPMAARRPLVACLLYRGGLRRRPHPNADHSLVSYRLWRRSANRRLFWQWALGDFFHQGATTTDQGAVRLTRVGAWRRELALPGRGGKRQRHDDQAAAEPIATAISPWQQRLRCTLHLAEEA